ncbi:hypothetical protein BGW38_009010 [Lunasporangiospora selenospora]|uniref:Condensin complex subunit 2 n=1 Tax=Lunasporangiospora selenospora TaxID=979761 RepID=A0A9P6FYA0_9FUNG|nr:hypothetical protein BGW38_009010 [Lunasporangiospora selenospora]
MLGQQPSHPRKSLENLSTGAAGSNSSNSGTLASPQTSSFSRFQDIEVPLGGTTELNDDAKEKSLRRRSLLDERAARRRSLLSLTGPTGADDGENRRRSTNSSLSNLGQSSTTASSSAADGSGPQSDLSSSSSKLRPSGTSNLLGVVDSQAAPLPKLLKVSADSFEQWLKLATDNKINANNSWNFALIDYFHEMSLLREGDSINFQKASCTLDGCVKIYTSRVDSVATETTKLLGGLATSAKNPEEDGGAGADEDGDEEQDKPVKKKSSRSGNTLAKDFTVISLDKFNLEFSVDPLFKKTSADFDEGGARGLLLNHLNVDAEGKIIFDAGDARDEGDEDDESDESDDSEEEEDDEEDDHRRTRDATKKNPTKRSMHIESTTLDMQRLRSKFLPSLNQIFYQDICPSLKDFQLGSSEMDFSFLKRFQDDGDERDDAADDNDGDEDSMDYQGGDDMMDGPDGGNADFDADYSGGFGDEANIYGHDDDEDDGHAHGLGEATDKGATAATGADKDPNHVEDAFGDLDEKIAAQRSGAGPSAITTADLVETDDLMGKSNIDMYSYFDSALLRNWAGPEHWKLRRVPREKPNATALAGATPGADGTQPTGDDEAPKKKGGKVPFVIDFVNSEEVDEDDLFAPADPASLKFSASTEAENHKSKHLLPDDVHFSSKQLLRMFTKTTPVYKSMRKQQLGSFQQNQGQDPGKSCYLDLTYPDEQFWASHANDANNDNDVAALTDQLDQTQIYNDYIEDDEDEYGQTSYGPGVSDDPGADMALLGPGAGGMGLGSAGGMMGTGMMGAQGGLGGLYGFYGGIFDGTGDGNDYASQLVSQPKRVKAAAINFSKTAKKVDVKRLKDNIWKEMTLQALKRQPATSRDDSDSSERGGRNSKKQKADPDGDEDLESTELPQGGEDEEVEEDKEDKDEDEDEDEDEDYVKKELRFSEVIGGLGKMYPEHKLRDISVPFCFISLLHLANEKNLAIVGSEAMSDLTIRMP